jgi:hypothetical protein
VYIYLTVSLPLPSSTTTLHHRTSSSAISKQHDNKTTRQIVNTMSSPEGPSITRLEAFRKQVSDASATAANAATRMAMASAMANHTADAAADIKAAVDDAYAAAIKVANAANTANAAHNGPPPFTNNANPTMVAISAPRATTNDDDSEDPSPTPHPTLPEGNSLFFQLITVLATALYFALYFVIWTTPAAVIFFFTWKIFMSARAAVLSLGVNDFYLALLCSAFTVSFATIVWLRE